MTAPATGPRPPAGPVTSTPPSGPKTTARELVHVPFRDGEVLAVEIDGAPWIVLRPAFEAIGLDAARQIDNVRSRKWATTAVTAVVADDGRVRDMIVCTVRTFLMALAAIPTSRVSDRARPVLEAYQSEVADVIEAYWTRGVAVNPRSGGLAPRTLTLTDAAGILRQEYGLPLYTPVDLTRALEAAGITRLAGGPKKQFAAFMWCTGSTWLLLADYIGEVAKRLGRAEKGIGRKLDRGVQLELTAPPP